MKRVAILILPMVLLAGCCGVAEEQTATKAKWGAQTNVFCEPESGMMMKEYFPFKSDIVPTRKYIKGYNSELVPCKEQKNDIAY